MLIDSISQSTVPKRLSQLIMIVVFLLKWQVMLYTFLFRDIITYEFGLVVLKLEHFFHLSHKLPYFNQFLDCIRDGDHLVRFGPYNANLQTSSRHQLLEVFGHLCHPFCRLRSKLVSDCNEYHLSLLLSKGYTIPQH